MQYSRHIYDSGLTLIRIPMDSVKSVTVLALVKVGSRYEQANVAGISHFVEHMVFKGTEKYPTAQDIASAVDAVGAEFNAFTSKEYTGYYVKSASKDIQLSLDVVSDMLLTPTIPDDDLQREKGVIVEEISMYEDSPMRHIADIFDRMMYDGASLGQDIIGTRDTVKGMKREDFINHFHKWYGLANMVLIVAGDSEVLNADSLLTQIDQYFSKGDVSQRDKSPQHVFEGNPISPTNRFLLTNKKTEQAHFILGFPSFKRGHKNRFILSVLSTLLGGNMSSRLFTEVREKRGLCYYVHTDIDTFHDAGVFSVCAGVDTKRVEEALSVIMEEFKALKDGVKPVTEEELRRAKEYSIGHLILGMEDSQSVAQYYGMKQLLEGKILTMDEVIAGIQAVTLEDLNKVIQTVIKPEEARFAMIGPFEDGQKFKELLNIK